MSLRSVALAAVVLLANAGVANAQLYFNDFNAGPVGAEWSFTSTETSPSGQRFLGSLGNGVVTLNLGPVAAGLITLDFDFYAIRSLDGNGPAGGGPDLFQFQIGSGPIATTSFDNFGASSQMFPSLNGTGTNIPGSGAIATNSLGYTFSGQFADAIYHITLATNHAGGNLFITFTSLQTQGADDEAWGIDNVRVIPTPTSAAGLIALTTFAATRRHRRR